MTPVCRNHQEEQEFKVGLSCVGPSPGGDLTNHTKRNRSWRDGSVSMVVCKPLTQARTVAKAGGWLGLASCCKGFRYNEEPCLGGALWSVTEDSVHILGGVGYGGPPLASACTRVHTQINGQKISAHRHRQHAMGRVPSAGWAGCHRTQTSNSSSGTMGWCVFHTIVL